MRSGISSGSLQRVAAEVLSSSGVRSGSQAETSAPVACAQVPGGSGFCGRGTETLSGGERSSPGGKACDRGDDRFDLPGRERNGSPCRGGDRDRLAVDRFVGRRGACGVRAPLPGSGPARCRDTGFGAFGGIASHFFGRYSTPAFRTNEPVTRHSHTPQDAIAQLVAERYSTLAVLPDLSLDLSHTDGSDTVSGLAEPISMRKEKRRT